MTDIVLLTVATDVNKPHFKNWKRSAEYAGWPSSKIAIVGENENWGGWEWRCKKISEYCDSLPKNNIVIFCDSYDLLIFGSPKRFRKLFKSKKCDIMVGLEYMCGTKYSITPSCAGSLYDDKNIFVCGGGITGRASSMSHAYKYIGKYTDDQIGWYNYIKNNNYPPKTTFYFDENNEMIFNMAYGDHKTRNYQIRTTFEFITFLFNPWKTINPIKKTKLLPSIHGVSPLMIHTPGINSDSGSRYNYIGMNFLPKRVFERRGLTFNNITSLTYMSVLIAIVVIIVAVLKSNNKI